MAPPTNRRSKQGSSPSPSPNPLPGIAIGIVAVVAAGFTARQALRRKRRLQSEKDEEHAVIPLLVLEREIERNGKNDLQCTADGPIDGGCDSAKLVTDLQFLYEREIEINEENDLQCTADGTIDGAAKLGADLEFLVDVKKDGLSLQKGSAEEEEGQEDVEEAEALDGQILQQSANEEGNVKKVDAIEGRESSDEDGELSHIAVIKASLILDGASAVRALHSAVLENYIDTVEEEDTGEDGDDDRSSAGQQPSPVLINGRIFEFFDEMADLRDEPDHSTSGGYSLSDSVSECSMQEVSSAPVKPLVLADEALETSWMATKPDFVGASDQFGQEKVLVEEKSWPDVEKVNKELPEIFCPQVEREGFDSKEGFADSIDELNVETDVHDGESLPTANGGVDFSISEVNVEILSDNYIALKGEFSVKLNGDGTESARINGKVLFETRSSGGECHKLDITSTEQALQASNESANDVFGLTLQKEAVAEFACINGKDLLDTTSTEQALQASNESANDVLGLTLQKEAVAESACINGKVLSDESHNFPYLFVGFTPDDRPSLQSQEGACHDVFETDGEIKLQLTKEVPLDISHSKVEVECLVESLRDMPGLRSDGKITAQASRGDYFHVDDLDLRDVPRLESVGKMDSKETLGVFTNNLDVNVKVEPAEELTQKMTGLESVEEPAMQSSDDVPMVGSIKDDIPDGTHDMAAWKDCLEISSDNMVVNSKVKDSVESTQGRTSLESGPLEKSLHAEEPAMRAGGDDDTISEIIEDDIRNATHDTAGLGVAGETNLKGMEGPSTDNPVVNSEVLPIVESTQKLPSLENGPLEEFIGGEPVVHSGGHGVAISAVVANDNTENNVGTQTEQPGSFLEDSREDNELSPRPNADKVEHSSTATAGRKEDELAEFDIAHSSTEQEIEEVISADDTTDDLKEIARPTHSQHTSISNTREIDQVFTKGAGLQSRSTLSSKVLRYLPVEIGLICLLIALVSFLLQYLEGSLLIQQ